MTHLQCTQLKAFTALKFTITMTSPHRPAASLRIGEKRILSIDSITSTGSEQLEGEHEVRFAAFVVHLYSSSAFHRSQISMPQPKRRLSDKFKQLFTSKSKNTSQIHIPGVPGENIHPAEVCTIIEVLPITYSVTAPQDQGSSYTTNRETLADQLIPDLGTVDAAREVANRAVSEMMPISPISVDNPIYLVINKLASFNSVVDKIATVRYAVLTWPVHSSHA